METRTISFQAKYTKVFSQNTKSFMLYSSTDQVIKKQKNFSFSYAVHKSQHYFHSLVVYLHICIVCPTPTVETKASQQDICIRTEPDSFH